MQVVHALEDGVHVGVAEVVAEIDSAAGQRAAAGLLAAAAELGSRRGRLGADSLEGEARVDGLGLGDDLLDGAVECGDLARGNFDLPVDGDDGVARDDFGGGGERGGEREEEG